jgi:hypothetical protein
MEMCEDAGPAERLQARGEGGRRDNKEKRYGVE